MQTTKQTHVAEHQRLVQLTGSDVPITRCLLQQHWYAGINAAGQVGAVAKYAGYCVFRNSESNDVQFAGSVHLRLLPVVAN